MAKIPNPEITLENHSAFYAIASQQLREVERLVQERDSRGVQTDDDATWQAYQNEKIEHAAMVTVVFSALALEAFINAYGIEKFSRNFFDEHLDKLNTESKWLLLPMLAVRKEIPRGGDAHRLIVGVLRLRHRLVHYKIRKKRVFDLREDDWVTEGHARDAIRAVGKAVEALHSVDGAVEMGWLDEAEAERP